LLDVLSEAGAVLDQTTVVCLDRPGPDTTQITASWLERYPGLQVATRLVGGHSTPRRMPLDPAVFEDAHRFCKAVAGMLRPGGLLLQDIQLATLGFIPPDRWWESIYLANTVRGMFAGSPPACRFLSNKRGYEATFGRDLLDAGFDPRDVMDKSDPLGAMINEVERIKASIRAKVEHPFRVIKRQFGFVKVRYRGLKKNTAQLMTLFALSNLWMARGKLLKAAA
jgi:hypothetical protein